MYVYGSSYFLFHWAGSAFILLKVAQQGMHLAYSGLCYPIRNFILSERLEKDVYSFLFPEVNERFI